MAVLFMDGFDHYNTILQKWTASAASNSFGSASPATRFAVGQWFTVNGVSSKTLPSNYGTLYMGHAWRSSSITSNQQIMGFRDSGSVQVDVRVQTNGSITITRNGTLLATSSVGLITVNVWYHFGLKVKFGTGTSGTYDVWLNGVNILTSAGANTQATGNSTGNEIFINGNSGVDYHDDIYVGDTSGSAPQNDFLGDRSVDTQYPAGAGYRTQFTPSAGSNWSNVNETPPNSDTSYNADATIAEGDSFTPTTVRPLSGNVDARQFAVYARKDDAATKILRAVTRHSSTNTESADMVLAASYQYFFQMWQTNPSNGGAAWSVTDCNNDEIGYVVNT